MTPYRTDRLLARSEALSVHFDLGLRAYDAGDSVGVARHRAAVGMLPEGGPRSLQYLALKWRELWLGERWDEALDVARTAAERYPDDADTALELGDILTDLGADAEALETLLACARQNVDDPDLWYEVGVVAERTERWDIRHEAFSCVWDLEHEREPGFRLYLPEARFLQVAEDTIGRLPPTTRQALGNVAVMVDNYPDRWILETEVSDPRLLGLFSGPERALEGASDHVAWGPAMIHLFRWNIERVCSNEEEVVEQVEITVLHEIGHYLGLDEEALHARGLG